MTDENNLDHLDLKETSDLEQANEETNKEETVEQINEEQIGDKETAKKVELEQELAAKAKELEELNNRYIRLQADFDNYRKRTLLEKEGLVDMVSEYFIKDFLPVVDDFERAVDSAKSTKSVDAIISGLDMALNKFQRLLTKKNVFPVTVEIGKEFDPECQEAIMIEETDEYPENTVIEELQKGYIMKTKFGTKLIRPAFVKITKLPG
ncbi:MAG TPA: nucleotide exchange factor GrpE [Clostridia bacterium]|jgi:molecular chaperone GrpE|nr:nucleotide exchange factor GrpE [Clostridia bacterium]